MDPVLKVLLTTLKEVLPHNDWDNTPVDELWRQYTEYMGVDTDLTPVQIQEAEDA